MSKTNWTLDDEQNTVTAQIGAETLTLSTQEVEDLVTSLGDFRAEMSPQVATQWDPSLGAVAIPDPVWSSEPQMLLEGSLVHIRDPRFGWLHFFFPPKDARALGEALLRQADMEHAPPEPGAMN